MGKVLVSISSCSRNEGLSTVLRRFQDRYHTKPYVQLGELPSGNEVWVVSNVDIPSTYEYLGDWVSTLGNSELVIDARKNLDTDEIILLW